MNIFNLSEYQHDKMLNYVKRYVEAMGSTRQRNRDKYAWWDFENLKSSAPDEWQTSIKTDPSLSSVLGDAGVERGKAIRTLERFYGISRNKAAELVKTYVGYHPSYGAYLCQIGPYISEGWIFGKEHIVPEAINKFEFYVWRKRKSSAEEIAASLANNIEKYIKNFGIEFDPSDFKLVVKEPSDEFNPESERQKKKTVEEIPNLDPNNPITQDFYRRSPITGVGSYFDFNSKGYEKILRQMMGPWYQQTVNEMAIQQNKTHQEIINNLFMDTKFLKQIYDKTYEKWLKAKESGEAEAMGISKPPKFLDPSLRPTSGAQGYTSVKRENKNAGEKQSKYPKQLVAQFALRSEILSLLQKGIVDPEKIAEHLNANPARMLENKKRLRRKLEPINIPVEEVERHLNTINKLKNEEKKDINQLVTDTVSATELMKKGYGYSDLRTAFEMAATYFSSQPVDPLSGASLGKADNIVFNPSENFKNYTSQDLQNLLIEKDKREKIMRGEIEEGMPISKTPTVPEKEIPENVENIEKNQQNQPNIENPEKIIAKTIAQLLKLAKNLDDEGNYDGAEEIHKVIRKYKSEDDHAI
jgi:hypothetical protein